MDRQKSFLEKATFASGCFWCSEAIFKELKGVELVLSGYSGGKTKNPNYEEVSRGHGGYAEAIQIEFDPQVISYKTLVEVFFATHDPTSLNRQGNDVGAQYRSAIFCRDDEQKRTAVKVKEELERSRVFLKPITTEITSLENFYHAERYHQNYFAKNPDQPYCQMVINPKLSHFRENFSNLLKNSL